MADLAESLIGAGHARGCRSTPRSAEMGQPGRCAGRSTRFPERGSAGHHELADLQPVAALPRRPGQSPASPPRRARTQRWHRDVRRWRPDRGSTVVQDLALLQRSGVQAENRSMSETSPRALPSSVKAALEATGPYDEHCHHGGDHDPAGPAHVDLHQLCRSEKPVSSSAELPAAVGKRPGLQHPAAPAWSRSSRGPLQSRRCSISTPAGGAGATGSC